MSTGPKNTWGGRREGAGRPPGSGKRGYTLSQEAVERALAESHRFAEKFGKTIEELLCDIAWGVGWAENATVNIRLKAIIQVMDRTAPKIHEGGIADSQGNPPAILPARNPDPGKVH